MIPTTDLSPKAIQTRQHIYDTAVSLFKEQGYDATTMREIASTADVSIGLAYRYFARKEDIVMHLYLDHLDTLVKDMKSVPTGQLADRFAGVLTHTLTALQEYRFALMALFGTAMHPDSGLPLMGIDNNPVSRQLTGAYHQLVLSSEDALRDPKAIQLAVSLYTFHMMILIFWLYDRSPEQQVTHRLVDFVHELFKILRPMFILPMVPQAIAKLSHIIMPSLDTSKNT